MSWLLNLYYTYEANLGSVGKVEKKGNDQEYTLLPISHTTQNAHIEVLITPEGEFHSARALDKQELNTLIPTTESSASRSGKNPPPYPLHDKLNYVAGDFGVYSGDSKETEAYEKYLDNLADWANSSYAVDKVKSIYRYLSRGTLIADLIAEKVLYEDSNNRLIDKWEKVHEAQYGPRPPIYSVLAGGPESAFVRFTVYTPDEQLVDVWRDSEVYDSFIHYYNEKLGAADICYVTGQVLPGTERHANKIRHAADKAKLISSNDSSGFTYRGRFRESKQAAAIGYEVSQKAHNALKWLIHRQGKIIDERVFLVWGNNEFVPDPNEDSYEIDSDAVTVHNFTAFTNQDYALEFAKALNGYRNRLDKVKDLNTKVNIMILDAATTGRMAVLHYRNMDKELYLDKLLEWHSTCVWLHRYHKNQDNQFVYFWGAPSTKDIAFAAYGPRAGDKVIKGLMERMLPCIIDGVKLPRDIVASAFQRASNPVSMERWEWEKTLSIACALVNKQEKGGFSVALDKETHDRDYIFGRLLAVADVLERRALGPEENRATNAIRYMNSFARHPARTWATIQASLQPYQARLGAKGIYLSKIIDEVASKLSMDEFNNKPLSGRYLLGFYSQRHELYQKKEDQDKSIAIPNNEE